MNRRLLLSAVALGAVALAAWAYWKLAIPTHRVEVRSELVMLGDLDGDHRWTPADLRESEAFLRDPFGSPGDPRAWLLDMNQNGRLDVEDLDLLRRLVAAGGDPYAAHDALAPAPFPRPRELYRYVQVGPYRVRPAWALPYPPGRDSALRFLRELAPPRSTATYAEALDAEIYSEAVRFDIAYRRRAAALETIERAYAEDKLARVETLFRDGKRYELLLALIDLVEDAETLTTRGQPTATLRLLTFRDHLRQVLVSPTYAAFAAGQADWRAVLALISADLQRDLGMTLDLATAGPPRSLTHLENYLQRAEWQYYKTSAREADFRALIDYAQHDPRYLRAVARTSPRHRDPNVENHNLPMVLLFREALRIEHGDKKKAVGLLDEAIRIPYAWIKSIPRKALPDALALDNFLLPGNMEDGSDKSRHWNVFGGICLYKSPAEALELALKREVKDLREAGYGEPAMREFVRDMIADLNGMYHVMSVNPMLATQPAAAP